MRRKPASPKLNRRKPSRSWTMKNRPMPNWKLLLTVFLASTTIALGSTYISTTPKLAVEKVTVMGVTWADKAGIEAIGAQTRGRNVLFFNKRPLAKAILDMPEVESVRVDRVIPKTVKLRIQERKPCAILSDGKKLFLVDDAGVAFHQVSKPIRASRLLPCEPSSNRGQEPAILQWKLALRWKLCGARLRSG